MHNIKAHCSQIFIAHYFSSANLTALHQFAALSAGVSARNISEILLPIKVQAISTSLHLVALNSDELLISVLTFDVYHFQGQQHTNRTQWNRRNRPTTRLRLLASSLASCSSSSSSSAWCFS